MMRRWMKPKSHKTAQPKKAEQKSVLNQAEQAEIDREVRDRESVVRGTVNSVIRELPNILARAEKDPEYLERVARTPRAEKFWRAVLSRPRLCLLPYLVVSTKKPNMNAFSLLADKFYFVSKFESHFFSLLRHMLPGVTMAQIAFTQHAGRSSFALQKKWVESNTVAVSDNMKSAFDSLRRITRHRTAPKIALQLHALLDKFCIGIEELSLDDIERLKKEILPELFRMRDEEINDITIELDNAIRVTQGFYCMGIRSLIDVLTIESAGQLLATENIELPIEEIKKRALDLASKHGAPGLLVCARVYYGLSLYYCAKHQYLKQNSQSLFFNQMADYQQKAHVYATRAIKAAEGAVDFYRNEKNQQLIKNLGFHVGGWSLFYGVGNFEDTLTAIKEGLTPCLIADSRAAHSGVIEGARPTPSLSGLRNSF